MLKSTKADQIGKYETTLFRCCSDFGICCFVCCFYPCAESYVWAQARDEKCTYCHLRPWGNGVFIRSNVRYARGMQQEFCKDCITYSCCWNCALIQDWREIKLIKEQSVSNQLPVCQNETVVYAVPPIQNYQNNRQYQGQDEQNQINPYEANINAYQNSQYQNQNINQTQNNNESSDIEIDKLNNENDPY